MTTCVETIVQCGYHGGPDQVCRLMQLRAPSERYNKDGGWQEHKWICDDCRHYLTKGTPGNVRYVDPKTVQVHRVVQTRILVERV